MGFTWHAESRIRQRKLCKDEVLRAVKEGQRYRTQIDRWACILNQLVVIISDDQFVLTAFIGSPNKIERLMAA